MIRQKLLLLTFLILLTSICSSQTLTDSTICITHHQAKVINLAFNELTRMIQLDSVTKEQLGTKDLKIAQLQAIDSMRSDQLIKANLQLAAKDKELKQLKVKIVLCKIAILATSLGLLFSLL